MAVQVFRKLAQARARVEHHAHMVDQVSRRLAQARVPHHGRMAVQVYHRLALALALALEEEEEVLQSVSKRGWRDSRSKKAFKRENNLPSRPHGCPGFPQIGSGSGIGSARWFIVSNCYGRRTKEHAYRHVHMAVLACHI